MEAATREAKASGEIGLNCESELEVAGYWLFLVIGDCWLMISVLIREILSVKNTRKSLAVKAGFIMGEDWVSLATVLNRTR